MNKILYIKKIHRKAILLILTVIISLIGLVMLSNSERVSGIEITSFGILSILCILFYDYDKHNKVNIFLKAMFLLAGILIPVKLGLIYAQYSTIILSLIYLFKEIKQFNELSILRKTTLIGIFSTISLLGLSQFIISETDIFMKQMSLGICILGIEIILGIFLYNQIKNKKNTSIELTILIIMLSIIRLTPIDVVYNQGIIIIPLLIIIPIYINKHIPKINKKLRISMYIISYIILTTTIFLNNHYNIEENYNKTILYAIEDIRSEKIKNENDFYLIYPELKNIGEAIMGASYDVNRLNNYEEFRMLYPEFNEKLSTKIRNYLKNK